MESRDEKNTRTCVVMAAEMLETSPAKLSGSLVNLLCEIDDMSRRAQGRGMLSTQVVAATVVQWRRDEAVENTRQCRT